MPIAEEQINIGQQLLHWAHDNFHKTITPTMIWAGSNLFAAYALEAQNRAIKWNLDNVPKLPVQIVQKIDEFKPLGNVAGLTAAFEKGHDIELVAQTQAAHGKNLARINEVIALNGGKFKPEDVKLGTVELVTEIAPEELLIKTAFSMAKDMFWEGLSHPGQTLVWAMYYGLVPGSWYQAAIEGAVVVTSYYAAEQLGINDYINDQFTAAEEYFLEWIH